MRCRQAFTIVSTKIVVPFVAEIVFEGLKQQAVVFFAFWCSIFRVSDRMMFFRDFPFKGRDDVLD
jgi:hypothetical protein